MMLLIIHKKCPLVNKSNELIDLKTKADGKGLFATTNQPVEGSTPGKTLLVPPPFILSHLYDILHEGYKRGLAKKRRINRSLGKRLTVLIILGYSIFKGTGYGWILTVSVPCIID
jgi:hypothetical protein